MLALLIGSSVPIVRFGAVVSLLVESVTLAVLPASSVIEAVRLTVPHGRPETLVAGEANCPAAQTGDGVGVIEPIWTVTVRPFSEQVPATE